MNQAIRSGLSILALAFAAKAQAIDTNDQLQQATSYIWPQVHQASVNQTEQIHTRVSNEYWQQVTGAQLNQGLAIYTSGEALVRLAPYANYESGAKQVSEAIYADELTLYSATMDVIAPEQLMQQAQMASAGFNDGSVAMTVSARHNKMMLKSTRTIADKGRYLLHVKEKNSPLTLSLSANSNVIAKQDHSMALNLSLATKAVTDNEVNVRLFDPKGQPIAVNYRNSTIGFKQDLSHFGAHQGLYELEVDVTKTINGKRVKRTLKFPFANTTTTASIDDMPIQSKAKGFDVPVRVFEPGRYSVTATLEGRDINGKSMRLQTASSANWLEKDGTLNLPFTLAKFNQYRDFKLVDLKLMDQTRMMAQQVNVINQDL